LKSIIYKVSEMNKELNSAMDIEQSAISAGAERMQ